MHSSQLQGHAADIQQRIREIEGRTAEIAAERQAQSLPAALGDAAARERLSALAAELGKLDHERGILETGAAEAIRQAKEAAAAEQLANAVHRIELTHGACQEAVAACAAVDDVLRNLRDALVERDDALAKIAPLGVIPNDGLLAITSKATMDRTLATAGLGRWLGAPEIGEDLHTTLAQFAKQALRPPPADPLYAKRLLERGF